MNRLNNTLLVLLLASALAACGAKKSGTKPDNAPVVAGKPASKPAAKPGSKPAAKPTAKPADPAKTEPAAAAEPPKTPEQQFADALAALKAKDLDTARSGFATLAKDHPELGGPLTNLGLLDAKAGKREAAIADFSRAVVANPDNALAYNWLGMLYRQAKAYPEAEKAYKRALSLKPNYPSATLNLAILYDVHMNHPGDALVQYRAYQELTGSKELKVTAWIKDLEAAGVVPPSAPAATPAAAPLATTPAAAPAASKPAAKPQGKKP